ncbi:MAG: ankyrin repeat domain-containing protein, partial [Actinomycetota bacterium]|nr:ankyrin repeat domain-containing protein [Actinomycetota bacterium]
PAAAAATSSAPSTTRDDELIDAASRGDVAAVRRLVDGGADVRARNSQGPTALVAAAYGNHVDAAQALIEAGADVNAKDPTEQSAYLIATSEVDDDPRLLERTLAAGADVQAKDSYNGTGLIRAGERGYPRIVDRLLRAGVEVDHVNRLGWTALLEAIILGEGGPAHVETVRLLLAGGADPNLPDRDGVTPLAHAQRRGQCRSAPCSGTLAAVRDSCRRAARSSPATLAQWTTDPVRAQSFLAAGFTLLGGGLPITNGGQVVGTIGVGGGSPEQDVQVAEAGLDALS